MSTYDYGSNFNPGYYLQTNADVKAAGVDPLQHYLNFGWKEGRNPSEYFDTSDYLGQYGDVKAAGVEPLQHYLQFGKTEGRSPFASTSSPIFDPSYYLAQNPDVKAAGVDPLAHYQQFGWREFRDPSAGFDTSSYLRSNPDVAQAGVNPYSHYQTYGAGEGRTFAPAGSDVGQANPPVGGGGGGTSPPPPPSTPGKTRDQVRGEGRTAFRTYFTGRGAHPDKYNTDIENRLAAILAGVSDADLNKTNLFAGEPESLYSGLRSTYRAGAQSAYDKARPANPFSSTTDDAIIDAILGEQRSPANKFISNMLKRGQIDDFGAERARNELNRQEATGRTKLNTLGQGIIDPEIAEYGEETKAQRAGLGNIELDAPYEVKPKSSQDLTNDFMFSLGNQLRSGAGSLFSTASLPSIAGMQGGGSQAFPNVPFKSKGGGGRTPGGGTEYTEDDSNILF